MDFPRFVYRSPGGVRGPGSACYKYEVVSNADEFKARLTDGWYESSELAIKAAGDIAFLYGLNEREREVMEGVLAEKKRKANKATGQSRILPEIDDIPEDMDTSPPTRAEMEEMAAKLNVRFDGRTSDAKLAHRIELALRSQ